MGAEDLLRDRPVGDQQLLALRTRRGRKVDEFDLGDVEALVERADAWRVVDREQEVALERAAGLRQALVVFLGEQAFAVVVGVAFLGGIEVETGSGRVVLAYAGFPGKPLDAHLSHALACGSQSFYLVVCVPSPSKPSASAEAQVAAAKHREPGDVEEAHSALHIGEQLAIGGGETITFLPAAVHPFHLP